MSILIALVTGFLIGALRRASYEEHHEFIITREEAQVILDLNPPQELKEDLEEFLTKGEIL